MSDGAVEELIRRAASAIGAAQGLLVTAGAGMGVDSGLPDFRGTAGFWRAYPVAAAMGLSFERLANPTWFERSPELAWAFYGHRLNLYRRTTPHTGYARLLKMAAVKPLGAFIFTSNVDGQFQKAGFAPERVVECHGSIQHFQCVRPCTNSIWDAPEAAVEIDEERFRAVGPLPRCRACDGLARPNVLMFGDWSWVPDRTEEQHRCLERWLAEVRAQGAKLVVVELGAGTAIPTVRGTSERIAARAKGILVRINVREPEVPPGHIGLSMRAAEAVERIEAQKQLC
jgi:NAD-dependent SIR2 family protein deacetylase